MRVIRVYNFGKCCENDGDENGGGGGIGGGTKLTKCEFAWDLNWGLWESQALGSDGKYGLAGVEYVYYGDRVVGFSAGWDACVWKDDAELTIAIGIANDKVRQSVEGGQGESVTERIGDVDELDANRCGMSSSAFLKLWQTQALWSQKKQLQAEEKTNATCQNGNCIEGLAGSWYESGFVALWKQ